MGYTHYWRKPNGLDKTKFKAFAEDVGRVLEGVDILKEEFNLETPPIISGDKIRFNGIDEDGHETFIIDPSESDFDFCKTAYKPYDKYVTACLILAKLHFGDAIRISSDGDYDDWKKGEALVNKHCEHKVNEQNYLG